MGKQKAKCKIVGLPGNNKSPLAFADHKIISRAVARLLIFLQPVQQLKNRDGIDAEVALTGILFEPHECNEERKRQGNAYNEGTLN